MTIADCQKRSRASKIKVEEGKRTAVFRNPDRREVVTTRIDGCVVRNRIAADYVVSKEVHGDVIVELKGRDASHGTKQILATARLWADEIRPGRRMAGLIVCQQYPRIATTIQRAKQSFAKAFRGPLHVVTQNLEYEFERVLSFDGPL